jgi:hypothetical protein
MAEYQGTKEELGVLMTGEAIGTVARFAVGYAIGTYVIGPALCVIVLLFWGCGWWAFAVPVAIVATLVTRSTPRWFRLLVCLPLGFFIIHFVEGWWILFGVICLVGMFSTPMTVDLHEEMDEFLNSLPPGSKDAYYTMLYKQGNWLELLTEHVEDLKRDPKEFRREWTPVIQALLKNQS